MKLFLKHAFDKVCVLRAVKTALVVGTLLGFINHYDDIIHGNFTATNVFQMLITYLVPYSVATWGSAMQARHMELQRSEKGPRITRIKRKEIRGNS